VSIHYLAKHHLDHGEVKCLAISPDKRYLAKAGRYPGLAVLEHKGAEGFKPIKQLEADAQCCAFSPDGCFLAFGGKTVTLLSLPSLKPAGKLKLSNKEPISALAWSPDSTTLAAAAETKHHQSELAIWELASNTTVKRSTEYFSKAEYSRPRIIHSMRFFPDGQRLAVTAWGDSFGVFVYDLRDESISRPSPKPIAMLHDTKDVALLEGGKELLVNIRMIGGGSPIVEEYAGQLIRWRLEGNTVSKLKTPEGYRLWSFALHPKGEHIALCAQKTDEESGLIDDKALLLISLKDGGARRIVGADELEGIVAYCFSADGSWLAVAGEHNRLIVYES